MLYMFQAVSPPNIRSSKTVHSIRSVSSLLAATASVGELEQVTHASVGSKQAWHRPDAVYSFSSPDDGRRNLLKHVVH